MAITPRNIAEADAKAVSVLSEQLGYPISEEETARRIALIRNSENDVAYVAVDDEKVIAWIHIFYTLRIECEQYCEVGGLVTNEQYRGRGVGKILLEKAREWCKTKGCKRLVVRSNTKRIDAHQFYQKQGFREIKQQKFFELTIELKNRLR